MPTWQGAHLVPVTPLQNSRSDRFAIATREHPLFISRGTFLVTLMDRPFCFPSRPSLVKLDVFVSPTPPPWGVKYGGRDERLFCRGSGSHPVSPLDRGSVDYRLLYLLLVASHFRALRGWSCALIGIYYHSAWVVNPESAGYPIRERLPVEPFAGGNTCSRPYRTFFLPSATRSSGALGGRSTMSAFLRGIPIESSSNSRRISSTVTAWACARLSPETTFLPHVSLSRPRAVLLMDLSPNDDFGMQSSTGHGT